MRGKEFSRGLNTDLTRMSRLRCIRGRPLFALCAFVAIKPGMDRREKAQSAQDSSSSQAVPNGFQTVSICSQAFPNARKQFPSDSQIVPILCLIGFALNTCRFLEDFENRSSRQFSINDKAETRGTVRCQRNAVNRGFRGERGCSRTSHKSSDSMFLSA
jgi:hypothetical protein